MPHRKRKKTPLGITSIEGCRISYVGATLDSTDARQWANIVRAERGFPPVSYRRGQRSHHPGHPRSLAIMALGIASITKLEPAITLRALLQCPRAQRHLLDYCAQCWRSAGGRHANPPTNPITSYVAKVARKAQATGARLSKLLRDSLDIHADLVAQAILRDTTGLRHVDTSSEYSSSAGESMDTIRTSSFGYNWADVEESDEEQPGLRAESCHRAEPPSETSSEGARSPSVSPLNPPGFSRSRASTRPSQRPRRVPTTAGEAAQAREDERQRRFESSRFGQAVNAERAARAALEVFTTSVAHAAEAHSAAGLELPPDLALVPASPPGGHSPHPPPRSEGDDEDSDLGTSTTKEDVLAGRERPEPSLLQLWPYPENRLQPCPRAWTWSEELGAPVTESPKLDWMAANHIKASPPPLKLEGGKWKGYSFCSVDSEFHVTSLSGTAYPVHINPMEAGALYYVLGGDQTVWRSVDQPTRHRHPVPAAARGLVDAVCADILRGKRVLDVGGSPVRHAHAMRSGIHCCTPEVSPGDTGRVLKWSLEANRGGIRIRNACECGSGVTWCSNKAEDCQCDYNAVMSLDSIYYLGEDHFAWLMRKADIGLVAYHRPEYQYDDYMACARVRAFHPHDTDNGRVMIEMSVPGNPRPYRHPFINISSNRVFPYLMRNGRALTRTVLATLDDYHIIAYSWGPVPRNLEPTLRGAVGRLDMRGSGAPVGLPIRDNGDELSEQFTSILLRGVVREGLSIPKVSESLVRTFQPRLSTFTSVEGLIDTMVSHYNTETQRINWPDDCFNSHCFPTVAVAAYKLLASAVARTEPMLPWVNGRKIRGWLGRIGLAVPPPRLSWFQTGEWSLLQTMAIHAPPPEDVLDLDEMASRALKSGRVFRPAGPETKVASPKITAGPATQRRPLLLVLLGFAVITLLMTIFWLGRKTAGHPTLPPRSFPCLSNPHQFPECATAMSGSPSPLEFWVTCRPGLRSRLSAPSLAPQTNSPPSFAYLSRISNRLVSNVGLTALARTLMRASAYSRELGSMLSSQVSAVTTQLSGRFSSLRSWFRKEIPELYSQHMTSISSHWARLSRQLISALERFDTSSLRDSITNSWVHVLQWLSGDSLTRSASV